MKTKKRIITLLTTLLLLVMTVVPSAPVFAAVNINHNISAANNGTIGANMTKYSVPSAVTKYTGVIVGNMSDFHFTVTLKNKNIPTSFSKTNFTAAKYALIPSKKDADSMTKNRERLQKVMNMVSEAGGGQIKLDAGDFYFNPDMKNTHKHEFGNTLLHCLLVKNNVTFSGTRQNNMIATWLYPVSNEASACDMFCEYDKVTVNADFKDFGIDGKYCINNDKDYLCRAKGFMIAPMEKCDWYNVIVMNTGGTGFGVDMPVNCTITNCTAIGCGKDCTASDSTQSGASGFGIGYGTYSDKESITLKRCLSLNNRRYGVFFENQYRFTTNKGRLKVTRLLAENCISAGNLYNYGGEYCFGAEYKGCQSFKKASEITEVNTGMSGNIGGSKVTCRSSYNFGVDSRDNIVDGQNVNAIFGDVPVDAYYASPVIWGYMNNITTGKTATTFAPNDAITRAEFVTLMWRYSGKEKVSANNSFTDVKDKNAFYYDAVMWAVEKKITTGTGNSKFEPLKTCSRAEAITFVWRLAGSPKPKTTYMPFKDVTKGTFYYEPVLWAYENKITEGIYSNQFAPTQNCSRGEAITFLYRNVMR